MSMTTTSAVTDVQADNNFTSMPPVAFEEMMHRLTLYKIELAQLIRNTFYNRSDELQNQYEEARAKEAATYRRAALVAFTFASCVLQACSIVALTQPEICVQIANTIHMPLHQFQGRSPAENFRAISDAFSKTFSGINQGSEALKHYWESGVTGDRSEAGSNAQLLQEQRRRQEDKTQEQNQEIQRNFQEFDRIEDRRAGLVSVICRG